MKKIKNQPQWIIEYNSKPIGSCKIIDNEFGCMLLKEFQGKGIGTKTYELVFEECKKLGIKTLKDTIKIDNLASLRFSEKSGFKRTGIIEKDGKPYAITLEKQI